MPQHSKQFMTARSTAALVIGAVAVVLSCIGLMLWVLGEATVSVDNTRLDGEHRLIQAVFETYQKKLATGIADYSNWNELYNNFTRRRDAGWERNNLGPYLTKSFDIDYVFVTTVDGSVVYAYSQVRGRRPPLSSAQRETLARLTAAAPQVAAGELARAASGTIEFGGIPGYAAIAQIRPTSASEPLSATEPRYYLIEFNALDHPFLSKTGKSYGVSGLNVVRARGQGVALPGIGTGRPQFALAWSPSQPGRRLFDRVLPAVLLIGALLLASFLGLMIFWRRIAELIRFKEARALNAELEATRARAMAAEEVTRNKSAFVANMSHELRTPLNAIIGFSEFIEYEPLGPIGVPKYREYVGLIKESGHHLLQIINDILLISKVEAGKYVLKMESFNLADVLSDSLRMMEVVAAKRNIVLDSRRYAPSTTVFADRQAIRQIIINVLSNAVKFSCDNSVVEIECADGEPPGSVRLRITDHGCGIPPKTLSELGKPFVQAENSYTRQHHGTGIGLAICFRMAAEMGVSLDVQSTLGMGTTVTLVMKTASAKSHAA